MRFSRRGVSPVLAELLLVFVSLIAGVAVGAFAFELIGASAQPAEVAARVDSCTQGGCVLTLTNVGTTNTEPTASCGIGSIAGILNSTRPIPSGGALTVECSTGGGGGLASGSLVTGWVALSNGARVYFAGTRS